MPNSFSLTVNSCQKICVNLQPNSCGFLPVVWNTPNPNIALINSSGSSAIITPNLDAVGLTTILITDTSGTEFRIYLTITSIFNLIPNPKYQYIYATNVLANFPSLTQTMSISGPFNSLVAPFQPDIVTFVTSGNTSPNYVGSSLFIQSPSNPTIPCIGSFAGPDDINLLLFGKTLNATNDPILVYADTVISQFQGITVAGAGIYKMQLNFTSQCSLNNYICFVQKRNLEILAGNEGVITSEFFTNLVVKFVAFSSLPFLDTSVIIIPKSFYDLTSPSLIFSKIFTNIMFSVSQPDVILDIPNIPIGDVCWFIQQSKLSVFAPSSVIFVLKINQLSTTTIRVSSFVFANATTNLFIMAYRRQSNTGFSVQ